MHSFSRNTHTFARPPNTKLSQAKSSEFSVIFWLSNHWLGLFLEVPKLIFVIDDLLRLYCGSLGRSAACPRPLPLGHAKGKLLTAVDWVRMGPSSFPCHMSGLPVVFLGCHLFYTHLRVKTSCLPWHVVTVSTGMCLWDCSRRMAADSRVLVHCVCISVCVLLKSHILK